MSVSRLIRRRIALRTATHLVRRSAYAAALAVLAGGVVSAPALAATTGTTILSPGDGLGGDLFGDSVSTSATGAVTAVGSPLHNSAGAVYIFSGTTQTAELSPSNPLADEDFGQTVSISGNGETVVAGAPGAGAGDQGAVYVFSDASGTWTQIAELTLSGTSGLGTSLAISTDASTIVAGAPETNNDSGEAVVYTKSGSTYAETQVLTEPKTATSSTSAAKVLTRAASPASAARKPKPTPPPVQTPPPPPALIGQVSAISSNGSTIAFGEPQVGVTDVFTKAAGASTWTQTAQLHGGGDSVAVDGSGTIIAAGQDGINNLNGAAFVFTESGTTFTEASEVLPPANTSRAAQDAGESIGISASGSVVAFGAPTATAGSAFESGEVFVATETSTNAWTLTATDAEPNPVSDDDLGGGDQGVSVAGNGSAIVAGDRDAHGTGEALIFP
jgi:hypothetical protein